MLNKTSENLLLNAAKWSKVLAAFALLLCAGRVALILFNNFLAPEDGKGIEWLLFSLAISAVPLFMGLYLFRFAQNATIAIESGNQLLLAKAFSSLKALFKLAAILAVMMVVSYTISLFLFEDSILR